MVLFDDFASANINSLISHIDQIKYQISQNNEYKLS